jgi:two-component system, LuxR family, sensor kinase FixL
MIKRLADFFAAPNFPDDEALTLRARVLYSVLTRMAVVLVLGGGIGELIFFDEKIISSLVIGSVLLVVAGCYVLVRVRKVFLAGILMGATNFVATLVLLGASGGLRSLHVMLFLTGTVLMGLVFGSKGAVAYSSASFIAGCVFFGLQGLGVLLPELFSFRPLANLMILGVNLALTFVPLNLVLNHLQQALAQVRKELDERKQIEEQLRSSERRTRNFIELSSDGIWMLAFDQPIPIDLPAEEQVRRFQTTGYIAECNDAIARMYGYSSSSEFLGKRLLELYGESPSEVNFQSTLKLVRDHYRSADRETVEYDRSGKAVVFLNNAVGIIQDGLLTAVWGTQRDVTRLKEAERALRSSEERMRALLEALPDMIFEIDGQGRIVDFIPAQDERTYLRVDQFMGQLLEEILPPAIAEPCMVAVQAALETGSLQKIEYEMQIGEVLNSYEARITPSGPDRVLSVIRNITDRVRAEEEREQLISELEAKNAELERFTYTVSHDLKSPLITIQGFLGYIEKDALEGNYDRVKADVARISSATEKMRRLLNDLLELSRIGRLISPPQGVAFTEIVREALELVDLGGVSLEVDPHLPEVMGDRLRLVEVMQNLIENAVKFIGSQPHPRIWIRYEGENERSQRIFSIADNGIGIDPKYHERVFGLFDKLDAQSEGTGVGLALVKRIIEVHEGQVWIESGGEGQGTKVLFSLPSLSSPTR